jgi:hypothetical protein
METGEPLPIPDAYKARFDEQSWNALPSEARKLIIDREERGKANRAEEVARVRQEVAELVRQEVQANTNGSQAPEKPAGNGHARSWKDLSEGEFQGLFDEAVQRQALAAAEPDNEEAVNAAKRLTPQMMREFYREEARRIAANEADSRFAALESKSQKQRFQDSLRSKIVQDFGGSHGDAILKPGNEVFETAMREYAVLKEANNGLDAPGLAYAAFKAAAMEAKQRGPTGGIPGRDREIESMAQGNLSRHAEISARRRSGDVVGAHKLALDAFLGNQDIPQEFRPNVRR